MTEAFDEANKEMRKLEVQEKKYKDKLVIRKAEVKKYYREFHPVPETWTDRQIDQN